MVFRLSMTLELERPDAQLAGFDSVDVVLMYEGGRWRGQCQEPPVATLACETLEEVLVTLAKEVQREWVEQPTG